MKRMFVAGLTAGLGLLAALPAGAQGDRNADLQQRYEKKLKKEFVGKVAWARSFDEARATAKKEGKLVFGYFSRSYAP